MSISGMSQTLATKTLDHLAQCADNTKSDSSRVVIKGSTQLTPVKAFFSSKTERQAVINKFQQALTVKYGQQIGDLAGARLDDLRSKGKALTAGMIRDIMAQSENMQKDLPKVNSANVVAFASSTRFAEAADRAFTNTGLPEGQKENFVGALKHSAIALGRGMNDKLITSEHILADVDRISNQCKEMYDIIKKRWICSRLFFCCKPYSRAP